MAEQHLICTIGYTQKTAEQFFSLLQANGVETLIDVRANNTSQLAAFTKRSDLPYFLDQILGVEYRHWEFLAPTPEIRDTLKSADQSWPVYERLFCELMRERDIVNQIDQELVLSRVCCLLCSEPTAEQCHRRLIAEHLAGRWPNLEIRHL